MILYFDNKKLFKYKQASNGQSATKLPKKKFRKKAQRLDGYRSDIIWLKV